MNCMIYLQHHDILYVSDVDVCSYRSRWSHHNVIVSQTASHSQSMADHHESIDLMSPTEEPSEAPVHSWFPGPPPPIYSCTLTPALVAKAREELQEKPEWRLRDVQALRDMILKVLFLTVIC